MGCCHGEMFMLEFFGFGVFVYIGTNIGLEHGLDWWAEAGMGVITVIFG